MRIPKDYKWMKPGVPCKTPDGYNFIDSAPWKLEMGKWYVELRFGAGIFCCFVKPNNDFYDLPTEQESREFQERINRGLKEMRGVCQQQ